MSSSTTERPSLSGVVDVGAVVAAVAGVGRRGATTFTIRPGVGSRTKGLKGPGAFETF
jgi:hypothetical protein